jgi:cholinephosphate cytidylyltransferase/choline kinase
MVSNKELNKRGISMVSEKQFKFLSFLLDHPQEDFTQRELAEELGLSLGKVNSLFKEMKEAQFLDQEGHLSELGKKALEPFRVQNAVIMAAGMSSRFAPLSYEIPKGLLKVKGQRLIEREIEQLQEAGIEDITVIVGYMQEKMFYLAEKYGVKIVVNNDYYKYNNCSSLMLVRDQLSNTYICSSDNYFVENPFEKYVYRGYYSTIFAEGETDEYCAIEDANHIIKGIQIGGENTWAMVGHVYFDRAFSEKFVEILEKEFKHEPYKEQLWEDYYSRHVNELHLVARHYSADIIKEFDSLDELRQFDERYLMNANSEIIDNICDTLDCIASDIMNIKPLKDGLTNTSFSFDCLGKKYVYRHPGVGTEKYIDRSSEAASMEVAAKLQIDRTFVAMSKDKGWKISEFITNARALDYDNWDHVEKAMELLRRLHQSGEKTNHNFDLIAGIDDFKEKLQTSNRFEFDGLDELDQLIATLIEFLKKDKAEKVLCHGDSYSPNFLLNEQDEMSLIDWEYSGMGDPSGDIGTFICCSNYTLEQAERVLEIYSQGSLDTKTKRHYLAYVAVTSYHWFLWALFQESVGKPVGEFLYIWYRYTKQYGQLALSMYLEED